MTRSARMAALTVVLALCAALAVAEYGLRSFAPVYTVGIQEAYQYDAELGYRLKPSVHQYELTDHLEEVKTNALGSVNFAESFASYPVLVFAVGDSYTQGTGNSTDAAYPFQLDLLLNQDADGFYRERYGVVNLGLAAFGPEQALVALERYAKLLGKPGFVLYFGCDNDADDDLLFRSGYRHRHIVEGSPTWGALVRPALWLSDFQLVKRVKLALGQLRQGGILPQEASPNAPTPSVAERVWPVVERMASLSREWNATLVLGWANPGTASYDWLRDKAAAEGIPFADWEPAMESVRQKQPGLSYANPHSGGHWRPWTNGVIAQTYARAMGVWSPQPAEPPAAR
ncbi:MAG: hypothetical protein ACREI8_10690 [Myxococcota bacterium]